MRTSRRRLARCGRSLPTPRAGPPAPSWQARARRVGRRECDKYVVVPPVRAPPSPRIIEAPRQEARDERRDQKRREPSSSRTGQQRAQLTGHWVCRRTGKRPRTDSRRPSRTCAHSVAHRASSAGLRVSMAMTSRMLAQRQDEAAATDRPRTGEVVAALADLLHDDCAPWSWSSHSATYHAGAALRILRALVDRGWQHEDFGVGAAVPPRPAQIRSGTPRRTG